jgi:hypothetical protein
VAEQRADEIRQEVVAIAALCANINSKIDEEREHVLSIQEKTRCSLDVIASDTEAIESRISHEETVVLPQACADVSSLKTKIEDTKEALRVAETEKVESSRNLATAINTGMQISKEMETTKAELDGPVKSSISLLKATIQEVERATQYQAICEESYRKQSQQGMIAPTLNADIAELYSTLDEVRVETDVIQHKVQHHCLTVSIRYY